MPREPAQLTSTGMDAAAQSAPSGRRIGRPKGTSGDGAWVPRRATREDQAAAVSDTAPRHLCRRRPTRVRDDAGAWHQRQGRRSPGRSLRARARARPACSRSHRSPAGTTDTILARAAPTPEATRPAVKRTAAPAAAEAAVAAEATAVPNPPPPPPPSVACPAWPAAPPVPPRPPPPPPQGWLLLLTNALPPMALLL
jgi:hypothetical protein